LTTRFGVSYNNKAIPYRAAYSDRPGRNVYGSTLAVSGTLSGAGLLAVLDNYPSNSVDETARKVTISGDATWFHDNFAGSHEVQVGMYLEPNLRQRTATLYANGGFVFQDEVLKTPSDPSAGTIPFHQRIYDTARVPAVFVDSSDNAFYVQDSWRPIRRLTASAGVRVDLVKQRDAAFNVRTMDSTNVGPRFGVNYLLTSDGRSAVRASWTRVHETPSRTATGAGSVTGGYTDRYDLDLNGTFETTFVQPGASALNPAKVFDVPNWHLPYVNEWTTGYRHQLPGQVSVDASVVRREFRDRSTGVDVNGIYDGGVFQGFKNINQNQIYLVANNVWNWPVYTAFELQVSKQTKRFQLIGSYTRQWRHLAGTWQPNDPAFFIEPNAFANDKGIGGTTGFAGSSIDANSLSGSQGNVGVEDWHDHSVHVGASYEAPFSMHIAATYIFQTGLWSGPVVTKLAAGDPAFGPATLTLANGRLVSNPLNTPIRFVGATRSDGQFTLPDVHILNFRVGRTFTLPRGRIEPAIDIYNVSNHDSNQYWQGGANQVYNPLYQQGRSRQLPRSAQLSVRFAF
jgi:hypothetical protein